jgi:hypothetical protein
MAISVTWAQAGARPNVLKIIEEMTIGEFLVKAAEVGKDGFEVLVNGSAADLDDLVEDGDYITLNPKKSFNG